MINKSDGTQLFEPYIDSLFADLPDTANSQHVKKALLRRLTMEYQALLADGIEKESALRKVLFNFGSMEALEKELIYQKICHSYDPFRRRYPKMIRAGFLGILILPLVFLVLMFSLDEKIAFLVGWIVSLIVFSVYLICVEYANYHYTKLMSVNKEQRHANVNAKISASLLEWLKQPLHEKSWEDIQK